MLPVGTADQDFVSCTACCVESVCCDDVFDLQWAHFDTDIEIEFVEIEIESCRCHKGGFVTTTTSDGIEFLKFDQSLVSKLISTNCW
jgi:hypothetical protein